MGGNAGPTTDGFRSVTSGLFLPAAQNRDRQIWTREEWKLLDRVATLCAARGLRLHLECAHEACQRTPLKKVQTVEGLALQCAHLTRVFRRG